MKKILISLVAIIAFILPGYSQSNSYDEETGLRLFKYESYSGALPYLQRAAKAGSLPALDALGQMYQKGLGVDKNTTNMMNMYSKAIARDYTPSMMNLAAYYANNGQMAKAIELCEKAAELGSLDACVFLSQYYFVSETDKALGYYQKRVSLGDLKALNDIGDWYYTIEDYPKALQIFMEARDKKVLNNENKDKLAKIFAYGWGTEKSLDMAYALLNELKKDKAPYDEELYASIDKEVNKIVAPKYPGGGEALYSFLRKNAKKPYIAIPSAGYGNVIVEFTITPTGKVTNAQYKKRVNVKVDEEVMRLVNMLGGWTPATKGGKNVSTVAQLSMTLFPSYSAEVKYFRVK